MAVARKPIQCYFEGPDKFQVEHWGCTAMDDTRLVFLGNKSGVLTVVRIRDHRGNLLFAPGQMLPVVKHIHSVKFPLQDTNQFDQTIALTSSGPNPRPPCAMISMSTSGTVAIVNLDTEEVTTLGDVGGLRDVRRVVTNACTAAADVRTH